MGRYVAQVRLSEGLDAQSDDYADAVDDEAFGRHEALNCHGVEVRSSRSDWESAKRDPSKAEAIAKYCDRWWIHTPPGMSPIISELPPAWGLRESMEGIGRLFASDKTRQRRFTRHSVRDAASS